MLGAMDPLALSLLSIFGGVALTGLIGFIASAVERGREHDKWVREQRYEAYRALLVVHMQISQATVVRNRADESGKSHERAVAAWSEVFAALPSVLGPMMLVGPERVSAAAKALEKATIAEDRDAYGAAAGRLVTEMQAVLRIQN